MSSEENPPQNPAPQHGGWQPVPHGGEYDADATAFVQLPPDGMPDEPPLAAPGHGYVPPRIASPPPGAAADPTATGSWTVPPQAAGSGEAPRWPEPAHEPHHASGSGGDPDPHATQEWAFPEAGESVGGRDAATTQDASADLTGQWTIPVAQGDLPDESGEFTTSSLASQWGGGSPPATLPGGAPAPWATTSPEGGTPAGGTPVPDMTSYPATLPGGAPAPWATEPYAEHVAPEERAGAAEHVAPEEPAGAVEPAAPEEPPGAVEPAVPEGAVEPEASAVPAAEPTVALEPRPTEAVRDTSDEPGEAVPSTPSAERHEPSPTDAQPATAAQQQTPEPEPPAEPAAPPNDEHPHMSYLLRVNGVDRPVTDAWIGESLLYVLRERLGLAGAKDGCSQGECGACNVQVDGRLVASCLVPAATAAGAEVRTVEGLAADGEPSDVQRALARCGAVQCGFCIPGVAMTVHDLLEGNHAPTELETRQALCGNLCRCSGYRGVLEAVREVVAEREASAAAADEAHDGAEGIHEGARIPHQAPPGAGSVQPHPHDGGMV
ncbi:2Fe-2S iron-sulfur cluster-binding protein [Streptomyces sp. NPDC059175]|uniref:(2Fe-2S)-binding protein n=1 Tax=Streptomyces sp. NPDC059175 TaxID=3346757 RepID=UPI003688ACCD